MPAVPPQLTCLFFTDLSVTAFLRSPAGRAFAGDLLVECDAHPSLGYVLNLETPANYPGVAGLLGGVDLSALAHPTDALPAPILLAPGAPVSPAALRAALARLLRPDDRLRAVTLLVPVGQARALGAALALAHRVAIAWDTAALPHEELLDFARWFAAERLLDSAAFAGVHAYHLGPAVPAHERRLADILAPVRAHLLTVPA